MYVVLATNTNHDDTVFGPFKTEKAAMKFKAAAGGSDHLHEHKVLEVQEAEIEEE